MTDLINAKDRPMDDQIAGLPDVSESVTSFFYPLVFQKVEKQNIDGFVQEILIPFKTYGVRQPYKAQQLAMLAEGQRAWRWETLHCLPEIRLRPDDVIVMDKIKFRIVERFDYTPYGYLAYNIVNDYSEAT